MNNTLTPVRGWGDLKQFGIGYLTGESCAYSMRMLCDVNEDGQALLADFFGMSGIQLDKNWNSTVGDKPAIGSILLVHDLVLKIAQFAFYRAGALAVVVGLGEMTPVFEQELLDRYTELAERYQSSERSIRRNPAVRSNAPMVGSRNVHAFSGRAA